MYTFTHLCLNCIPVEVAQMIKTLPALQEAQFQSLGWEDSLEEGRHGNPLSIVAWKIH